MGEYADRMFREVAPLMALGWKIVKTEGITDFNNCTCGKRDCTSPGKHPKGAGWQDKATLSEDTLSQWLSSVSDDNDRSRINLGVRLGPDSGIIDIEFDNPAAEAEIKQFGLDVIDTPAYSSGRSIHRIFQYESWMPQMAGTHVGLIEVRIGGGGKAQQSVLPPSRHYSGRNYAWLPGRRPEEIAPAKVPQSFRDALLKRAETSSGKELAGCSARAKRTILSGAKVSPGGRHDFLLGMASRLAMRIRKYSQAEFDELFAILNSLNVVYCDPPKGDHEIHALAKTQFEWAEREKRRAANDGGASQFERLGLEWNHDEKCWDPGLWGLTVIKGDPAQYVISFPNPNPDPEKKPDIYNITVDAETYHSASKMSAAIQSQTKTIYVSDPCAAAWKSVWSGNSETKSLAAKLFDGKAEVHPPSEYFEIAQHALLIYDFIQKAVKNESGDEKKDSAGPDTNEPKWIKDKSGEWVLLMQWNELCIGAVMAKGGISAKPLEAKQRTRLLTEMINRSGVGGLATKAGHRTESGGKKTYKIMRQEHIDALYKISEEGV